MELTTAHTMTNITKRDHNHIWHPCSQMKDYANFPPLEITSAQGSYITLKDGRQLIDATSSWWCKSLGHGHPRLKQALQKQSEQFEHIIFANTTYEIIVKLSEKLATLTKTLNKVFYASEGSSAVEIALKMSLHARQITGENQRYQFMALENGYHGETFMALAASDLALYKKPYQQQLTQIPFIKNIPYVKSKTESRWQDCSDLWPSIEAQLEQHAKHLTAIILEPIVQGAAGMLLYSQDFLKRLRQWTTKNNIHLIADEIMTGLGRTGYALACQHATIEPDFICLSKGLTAGFLPMSAVLTSDAIYQLFYDDHEKQNAFLHSHTYSGNALAAAVALACLNTLDEEDIYTKVRREESLLQQLLQEVAQETGKLHNLRGIGAIVAADLILDEKQKNQRLGYQIFKKATQLGALLRPLGNTLYWLPPLNTQRETLEQLKKITSQAILKTFD